MATLVTGAHGHVGAALVRELISRGRDVVTFDLQGGPGLDGLDVTSHTGDVRDADALRTAMAGCSTVFHLASVISTSGDKGGLVSSVNVDGARRVAEVALEVGVQRMVHTSSIHAYDIDTHGPPVTESTDLAIGKSRSAYNVSKAEGQLAVLEVGAKGLDVVVINPCGIIGPYDYKASRMGKFFRAIARGDSGPVGPGGFNWVDVRDVVEGALLAEARGTPGESYILSGHYNTNLRLGKLAADIVGKPIPDRPIPMWFLELLHRAGPLLKRLGQRPPVTEEALDALKANPRVSHAKATEALGYRPRPVEQTIADIYTWIEGEDILAKDAAAKAARKAAKHAKA
jgi:nucleoside-diphosphate-sugar epimerase